jgi:hypothetical protein
MARAAYWHLDEFLVLLGAFLIILAIVLTFLLLRYE